MKKGVGIFCIFALMLVLSFQFILSVSNETESYKISKAYDCLNKNIVEKNCSKLSLDEKISASLAVKKCNNELRSVSMNESQCWPNLGCNVKTTAQAILALHNSGINTDKSVNWLISQNMTSSDMDWFLQIESSVASQCKVSYSGLSYMIIADSDKKLDSDAGICLSLTYDKYWFKISPSCLDKTFTISCNESFLTSLIFKQKDSSTINVLKDTHSASENGVTEEKVVSSCMKQGTLCNYESTLWATLVLDSLDKDVSAYLPYLISNAGDNEKLIPETFLYTLTGSNDYYTSLMLNQQLPGYWEESGNKYYDTALALYPLAYDESESVKTARNWLIKNQGEDYCWESGDIKDTAWILHSVWPKYTPSSGGSSTDDSNTTNVSTNTCVKAGYTCMISGDCTGNIMKSFSCSGFNKCCDTPLEISSCSDQGGKVCTSSQECFGGTSLSASDLLSGQTCCVSGVCKVKNSQTEESTCESSGGTCAEYCETGYSESSSDTCDISTDVCCMKETKKSLLWFWIVLGLVILATLAIVFREKLQILFLKFKKGGKKGGDNNRGRPEGPSTFSREPMSRISPRRILPEREPEHQVRRPEKKSEIDDVLKKLKDMSK
jgi:hypothetical protein